MDSNEQQLYDHLSDVTDLSEDDLLKVAGASDAPFIDAALRSKIQKHGPIISRNVKTETDHHGFLWHKKAEEQKITLNFADGHKEKLYRRRELG